jgi:steroid 5-alpha reductase family enzyme
LYVVALPLIWIISSEAVPLDPIAILGVLVWLTGFGFEAISDYQLKQFRADRANKGKFIESGLWQYTRHPNYFGEVVLWWGIYLIALPVEGAWFTIVSPLVITFLILKVSGVPMLEEAMSSRPGFAGYERRISKFFPRPPKV